MSSSCMWFGGQDGSPIPMRMEHQWSTVAGRPAAVYGEEGGLSGSPDGQKRKVMERVPSGSGRAQRRESPHGLSLPERVAGGNCIHSRTPMPSEMQIITAGLEEKMKTT